MWTIIMQLQNKKQTKLLELFALTNVLLLIEKLFDRIFFWWRNLWRYELVIGFWNFVLVQIIFFRARKVDGTWNKIVQKKYVRNT